LRACKEAQQRAWGTIDNTTLGRYIAGEMSGDELAVVEQQLQVHPELRLLTDLVRDVLGETESTPVPEPAPRILALASAPPRTKVPEKRRGGVLRFLSRRSSLVAAACLLIVLGVAMPRPGFLSAPRDSTMPVMERGVASRFVVPVGAPAPVSAPGAIRPKMMARNAVPAADRKEVAVLAMPQLPVSPPAPMALSTTEADLTPEQAVELHRRGVYFQRTGDLVRAEASWNQVHIFCQNRLGDDHPATKSSARHLAGVYSVALNAANTFAYRGGPSPSRATTARTDPARELGEQLSRQSSQQIRTNVVPVLTQALRSAPAAEERRVIVRALGQLGPVACSAVPLLTERLEESTDREEIRAVLIALDNMGEAAHTAIVTLNELSTETQAAESHSTKNRYADIRRKMNASDRQLATKILHRLQSCEGRVGVRDDAGCFSVRTVRMSCQQLARLASTAGVEVFVSTCEQGARKNPSRLARMGPRSVHVFIDPAAPSVQVELSAQLQREGFSVDRLREPILVECRKRRYDLALAEGVKTIRNLVPRTKK
jgi:hypothetical protein